MSLHKDIDPPRKRRQPAARPCTGTPAPPLCPSVASSSAQIGPSPLAQLVSRDKALAGKNPVVNPIRSRSKSKSKSSRSTGTSSIGTSTTSKDTSSPTSSDDIPGSTPGLLNRYMIKKARVQAQHPSAHQKVQTKDMYVFATIHNPPRKRARDPQSACGQQPPGRKKSCLVKPKDPRRAACFLPSRPPAKKQVRFVSEVEVEPVEKWISTASHVHPIPKEMAPARKFHERDGTVLGLFSCLGNIHHCTSVDDSCKRRRLEAIRLTSDAKFARKHGVLVSQPALTRMTGLPRTILDQNAAADDCVPARPSGVAVARKEPKSPSIESLSAEDVWLTRGL